VIVESGIVTQTNDLTANVRVNRSDACSSCGTGCVCAGESSAQSVDVVAHNPIGAQKGDRVELSLSTGKLLGLSAVTYILPILFLFIGALTGNTLAKAIGLNLEADMASALTGFLFLVLSFLAVAIALRKHEPGGKISPIIVRVIH
jgi:sigma-E factor negative regulatory protein RseC